MADLGMDNGAARKIAEPVQQDTSISIVPDIGESLSPVGLSRRQALAAQREEQTHVTTVDRYIKPGESELETSSDVLVLEDQKSRERAAVRQRKAIEQADEFDTDEIVNQLEHQRAAERASKEVEATTNVVERIGMLHEELTKFADVHVTNYTQKKKELYNGLTVAQTHGEQVEYRRGALDLREVSAIRSALSEQNKVAFDILINLKDSRGNFYLNVLDKDGNTAIEKLQELLTTKIVALEDQNGKIQTVQQVVGDVIRALADTYVTKNANSADPAAKRRVIEAVTNHLHIATNSLEAFRQSSEAICVVGSPIHELARENGAALVGALTELLDVNKQTYNTGLTLANGETIKVELVQDSLQQATSRPEQIMYKDQLGFMRVLGASFMGEASGSYSHKKDISMSDKQGEPNHRGLKNDQGHYIRQVILLRGQNQHRAQDYSEKDWSKLINSAASSEFAKDRGLNVTIRFGIEDHNFHNCTGFRRETVMSTSGQPVDSIIVTSNFGETKDGSVGEDIVVNGFSGRYTYKAMAGGEYAIPIEALSDRGITLDVYTSANQFQAAERAYDYLVTNTNQMIWITPDNAYFLESLKPKIKPDNKRDKEIREAAAIREVEMNSQEQLVAGLETSLPDQKADLKGSSNFAANSMSMAYATVGPAEE